MRSQGGELRPHIEEVCVKTPIGRNVLSENPYQILRYNETMVSSRRSNVVGHRGKTGRRVGWHRMSRSQGSAGGGDYWKSWAAFFRNVVKLNDAVMTVEDCFEMLATSEGIGDVPRTSHRRLIG